MCTVDYNPSRIKALSEKQILHSFIHREIYAFLRLKRLRKKGMAHGNITTE
jgi:hypothetical protein